ncbi:TetR/AcrR family transcriptional regulator [Amycolatopsis nigrescens]|uniref:TetR/AcrR family transcriptional regulator n=1 Tax=Amycolatopsis nigrescens TaxID=381445 RepID=UPI00035DB835|nr:TetR/AcrR family transcriptional regulator [Amycolatopsis nigrescens]
MSRQETGGTRERILDTARDLFSAHTYRAASMREIAERVGITKPSLYHHFRSKTEILESLLAGPVDQLAATVEDTGVEAEVVEVRHRVLRGCIDVMVTHRDVMVLLLRDASVYGEETTQLMSRVLTIMERATTLLAGPDPDWRGRLRAAQALAAATDPISYFTDVPGDELREELFRGAAMVLGLEPDTAG